MNLHEYQAKRLFARHGIPVPRSLTVSSVSDVRAALEELGGDRWVVKAQVHSGARGKADGVVLTESADHVERETDRLIGGRLVTRQTGAEGLPIGQVLIEHPTTSERELYLGALVDREAKRVVIMASADGGMDIEEVAAKTPERILTTHVHPATGLMGWQSRKIGYGLGLNPDQVKSLDKVMRGLYQLFIDCDASLVEINPLVVTPKGELMALDAKLNLDDNALYRHPELVAMRDITQEDAREAQAKEHDLNYISLDGNIGCMVNGAGLAMATMDVCKLHGGEPANFLDVGGGATADRVARAFKLILSSDKVKAILVNIFGGIVRCDLIAEGIIQAVKEVGLTLPVVVRLQGTNVEAGREMLAKSGMNIMTADDLTDAAKMAVAAAAK